MSTLDDINDRLLSSGGPTIKLSDLAVGEVVKGRILGATYQQKTDFKTREPLFFKDGRPREQLVLTVRRDGVDEDERIFMHFTAELSLQKFLRDKGLRLDLGGVIAIQRIDDTPPKTRSEDPQKNFRSEYAPPAQPTQQPTTSLL